MTGRAVTKDEHRTDRRGKLIPHRQSLETIASHQFFTGLRGIVRFRIGFDYAGGNQRLLHVTPAARFGARVGAFLGNGRCARQPGIEAGIDPRIWMNDRHIPIMAKDTGRAGIPLRGPIIESRPGRSQPFRADFDRGECQAEATKKNQQEKASHGFSVCKARTNVASDIMPRWRTIFGSRLIRRK